jgi:hypothetical protein
VSDYSATMMIIDGCLVVADADDTLLVHDDLWRQFERNDDDRPGAARIDTVDFPLGGPAKRLEFGLADNGLGRLAYRYVCFVPQGGPVVTPSGENIVRAPAGVHVLERITT